MSVRVDSGEDSGGKAMTMKETRLLLAINSSESTLIDAMTKEMFDVGSHFDVEVFVDVFRTFSKHFVAMLSPGECYDDDSDEEDELPLPKKFLPFLKAFANSRDTFVTAIENNYKSLYKKDLKQVNFSMIKSYPEEFFKRYEKSVGREMQPNSTSLTQSHPNEPSNPELKIEEIIPSIGIIDDSLNRINMNDVSVDTDHASLMSAQEEEIRKAMESESDTPTPTRNESLSFDAPLTIPPVEQILDPPTQHSYASPPTPSNVGREVASVDGREEAKEEERSEHGDGIMQMNQAAADIEEQVVNIMNGLTGTIEQVHQDLRFALPGMVERAVRAYLKEGRPLTLAQFIGEEYADPGLESFVEDMMKNDEMFRTIIELEVRPEGTLVHLRQANRIELNRKRDRTSTLLLPANDVDFYLYHPLLLQDDVKDVTMPSTGVLDVSLSKLTPIVERQLEDLLELNIDHLKLSSECQLEKGRAVVLKSDSGTYYRGVIQDNWTRNSDGTDSPVNCHLIDHGACVDIPINVVYAFPKWTDTIHPALHFIAKLQAYPKGATEKSDKFSQSDWDSILAHFKEWKNNGMDIDIVDREGDVLVIDLRNREGHSFTRYLVERELVQMELTSPSPRISPPSNVCTTPFHDQAPNSESSLGSDNALLAPVPSMLPSSENTGQTQSEVVNATDSSSHVHQNDQPSMDNPSIEAPAFGAGKSTETKGEVCENMVKDIVSHPTIPASMHVYSEDVSKSNAVPSLVVRRNDPAISFRRLPQPAGFPSILKIVDHPPLPTPPPIVTSFTRKPLIEVVDDDE